MKLQAHTPAGILFRIPVWLTGQLRATGVRIHSVEVKTLLDDRPLRVDPGDLCTDDGAAVTREELLAEIKRVNDASAEAMRSGPLGKSWP